MELYILRHAIAAERSSAGHSSDSQRPLTPEGLRKLKRIVRGMKSIELSFDLILSSPYKRARQTADVVATTLGLESVLELSVLLEPGAELQALIADLASRSKGVDRILLVGHEPMLSSLTSLLLSVDAELDNTLKKSGL